MQLYSHHSATDKVSSATNILLMHSPKIIAERKVNNTQSTQNSELRTGKVAGNTEPSRYVERAKEKKQIRLAKMKTCELITALRTSQREYTELEKRYRRQLYEIEKLKKKIDKVKPSNQLSCLMLSNVLADDQADSDSYSSKNRSTKWLTDDCNPFKKKVELRSASYNAEVLSMKLSLRSLKKETASLLQTNKQLIHDIQELKKITSDPIETIKTKNKVHKAEQENRELREIWMRLKKVVSAQSTDIRF